MDVGSIAALIGSLKTIGDITKGMVDLRDAAAFQSKLIDLQREIMAAQSGALSTQMEQFDLLGKVRSLESQVAQFESWEREKRRYKLTDFGSNTFAYALIQDAEGGEPPHYLCANCFMTSNKSILQFQDTNYLRQKEYFCGRCQTKISLGTPREPPSYDPPRGGGGWAA